VDWILEQEAQGFPPSHARARQMASRILRIKGDTKELGNKWVNHFIKRNPRVASAIGRKIDASRISSTHPDLINEFYTLYRELVQRYNIQPSNTWNMDEHGIALGVCMNAIVLASSTKRRAYVKSPETREWVSIVEAISATAQFITPLIIFKGQSP
jgi:hypothetical protein